MSTIRTRGMVVGDSRDPFKNGVKQNNIFCPTATILSDQLHDVLICQRYQSYAKWRGGVSQLEHMTPTVAGIRSMRAMLIGRRHMFHASLSQMNKRRSVFAAPVAIANRFTLRFSFSRRDSR